jgi:pimeloyl-ACP methyl ester carboxylesterase
MARLLPAAERLARFALHRRGFESREVATRLGALHAYDARGRGALPPVVVLHGIGSAATPFGPVLTRLLGEVQRVTAPDLPGHGFSAVPTQRMTPELLGDAVTEALDALIDEPAIVCGNSLGGALALRYALDRPAKVRALVLVSPAGARITEADFDALRRAFEHTSNADTVAFLGRLYHRRPWFAPLVAGEVRALLRRPVVRELLESATPDHGPSPEELASLTLPVLLLWGRSERLLPPSALAYFRAHLPPHAVIEEPDAYGHCPHFDDPVGVAARVLTFARSIVSHSGEGATR